MSQDPERLKDSATTPSEVGDALRALREPTRDAARIARVELHLGTLLDAPPPAAGAAGVAGAAHTLRWLIVGCVGAGVLWLGGAALFSRSAQEEARAPTLATPAPTPVSELEQPKQTAALPSVAAAPQSPEVERSVQRAPAAPASKRSARTPHIDAPSRTGSPTPRSTAHTRATEATSASSSEASLHQTESVATTAAATPRPASAPQDAGVEQRPKSEVELLFEARAMRGSQPREALRLLDEHAKRFGDGMLAPEREVMAIEILRSLGQTADADARLARFRARYPKSLHLRRLEQSAPR